MDKQAYRTVYVCHCGCGTVITQQANRFYFDQTGMDVPELIEAIDSKGFVNGKYSVMKNRTGDEFINRWHRVTGK